MVDNRITSIPSTGFKHDNASANKMSEEKYGQGGEYYAQEMEEENQEPQQTYQDRSAQLRASLNGLAAANAGSIMFLKAIKEKEEEKKKSKSFKKNEEEKEESLED